MLFLLMLKNFAVDYFSAVHINIWLLIKPFYDVSNKPTQYSTYSRPSIAPTLLCILNMLLLIGLTDIEKNRPLWSIIYLVFTILSFYYFWGHSSALRFFRRKEIRKEKALYKVANVFAILHLSALPLWVVIRLYFL